MLLTMKKHPCLDDDTNEFICKYVKYYKYDKDDETRLINIFHILGYAWTDDVKDSESKKDKAELLVVYETCYQQNMGDERNQIYTRKFENFIAKVDKEKHPESKQEYIFDYCSTYEVINATHSYYAKKERDSRKQSDIEATCERIVENFKNKPIESRNGSFYGLEKVFQPLDNLKIIQESVAQGFGELEHPDPNLGFCCNMKITPKRE